MQQFSYSIEKRKGHLSMHYTRLMCMLFSTQESSGGVGCSCPTCPGRPAPWRGSTSTTAAAGGGWGRAPARRAAPAPPPRPGGDRPPGTGWEWRGGGGWSSESVTVEYGVRTACGVWGEDCLWTLTLGHLGHNKHVNPAQYTVLLHNTF